jgi:hypothetical protein
LFTTGEVIIGNISDGKGKSLCKIAVHNLGDKVATGIIVSIGTLFVENAEVTLSPPRQFTKEIKSGVLYIQFDALDAGDELSILLEDDVITKETIKGNRFAGAPYYIHASCKEGSDHSSLIGIRKAGESG